MPRSARLTREDTRALWYAVQCLSLQVRVMSQDADAFTPEQIKAEQKRLKAARLGLRKVNAIRAGRAADEPAGEA